MKRPDFFLVGAPKSGTTAMETYLKQHPEVFLAERTGIHFFGSDLGVAPYTSEEQYLENFRDVDREKRVGESSNMCLASEFAAREIKAFEPNASIIIMLRNPVDMMYALFSQRRRNGYEDIEEFSEVLSAEEDRRNGKRIPSVREWRSSLRTSLDFCYRDMGKYATQINRFREHFSPEQMHIIIFDDFVRDTALEYQKTLRFLQVDERFRPDFKIVNRNAVTRSRIMQGMLMNPPKIIWRTLDILLSRRAKGALYAYLMRFNEKEVPRPPMDPDLRRRLQDEFRPDVERLSELLHRDLTHWCRHDDTAGRASETATHSGDHHPAEETPASKQNPRKMAP